ncbi:MAG: DUF2793 domain-containing protein [Erythrobacter sp.]|uniref:DUF2793 domain-containing protein n=1 Tax=Erythrobacter sp. TaxID=1042 RepID=UPI003266CAFC
MADPIVFPSTTTRYSLPLLFAGQAQKEPFINQAFSLVDALMCRVIADSLDTPPSNPMDGESYRILDNAVGGWNGRDGSIAIWIGGGWEFIPPEHGMAIFDQTAGLNLVYNEGWQAAIEPAAPSGGSTIDAESRAAIESLIEELRTVGIFGNPTST